MLQRQDHKAHECCRPDMLELKLMLGNRLQRRPRLNLPLICFSLSLCHWRGCAHGKAAGVGTSDTKWPPKARCRAAKPRLLPLKVTERHHPPRWPPLALRMPFPDRRRKHTHGRRARSSVVVMHGRRQHQQPPDGQAGLNSKRSLQRTQPAAQQRPRATDRRIAN